MTHSPKGMLSLLALAALVVAATLVVTQYNLWLDSKDDLRFYNTRRNLLTSDETSSLSFAGYEQGGPCIAILVTNKEKDIAELQIAMKSLEFLTSDNKEKPTPVLIFNEGNLAPEQKKGIRDITKRPVAFPEVDFTNFPQGFDPNNEDVKFHVKDRADWGYYHMIRFWVSGIWKHPALSQFATVMRMDSDSCFIAENTVLPRFEHDTLVYHSQYVGYEDGKEFVSGLLDFAEEYMLKVGHIPTNPMLWQFSKNLWETESTLPLFNTNFEVTRKSWMQHPDVARWHDALSDQPPFGIYHYRWGDAVIRFMTAAMFSPNYRVDTSPPAGYAHKFRCSKGEVDEALAKIA